MHSTTLVLALGLALAGKTSSAPLSELAPTTGPLFTAVSRVHASTATGIANITAGEFPGHKHTPDCEHNYNEKHNITTIHHGRNTATEAKDRTTEGKDVSTEAMGNPSPYPGFSASAYVPPHAVEAHNHTGYYCNHPSHHNTTDGKVIDSRMLNGSAKSLHKHTGYRCAHPSHHNGSTTVGHSHDKKWVGPRADVTNCEGADCKESQVVAAKVDSARELTGVDATSNSKRMTKRQDTGISYEEVARQMSGAGIAGGT